MRYVIRGGKLVPKTLAAPHKRSDLATPMICPDIPDYVSAASGDVVSGRVQRREDLKRTGCREVDPGEYRPHYVNPEFAAKRGRQVDRESNEREPGHAVRYDADGTPTR